MYVDNVGWLLGPAKSLHVYCSTRNEIAAVIFQPRFNKYIFFLSRSIACCPTKATPLCPASKASKKHRPSTLPPLQITTLSIYLIPLNPLLTTLIPLNQPLIISKTAPPIIPHLIAKSRPMSRTTTRTKMAAKVTAKVTRTTVAPPTAMDCTIEGGETRHVGVVGVLTHHKIQTVFIQNWTEVELRVPQKIRPKPLQQLYYKRIFAMAEEEVGNPRQCIRHCRYRIWRHDHLTIWTNHVVVTDSLPTTKPLAWRRKIQLYSCDILFEYIVHPFIQNVWLKNVHIYGLAKTIFSWSHFDSCIVILKVYIFVKRNICYPICIMFAKMTFIIMVRSAGLCVCVCGI